ncbi:MAG: rhodanese-like domain-containing protein [Cyclobacteriaceae bacterium]
MKKVESVGISFFIMFAMVLTTKAQQTFDEKMESLYEHTVPLIDAEELESKLSADLIILDIRSPKEFEISHIQGAQLISYENFKKSDVKFIDKNQEVIVYCSVGYRSERIGEKLQNMGFKNVKNLYGGIFDWKNNGKIIVNNKSTSTDSVHTYNEDWSQWLYKGVKVYE